MAIYTAGVRRVMKKAVYLKILVREMFILLL